ncbi:MAG: hypothetical protein M3362_23420, partial [Acidobacteriota bacterium]|nr:hypothetical protein [Acidobacteriota bacterium]
MADEPTPLNDIINGLVSTYAALQEKPNKDLANSLLAWATALASFGTNLSKFLKVNLNDLGTPGKAESIMQEIDRRFALAEGVQLSRFFTHVSKAVIDAQKDLNVFSLNYIKELENTDNPRIPPNLFVIPKVEAQMKVGFSQSTTQGVNVIIFTNKEQKQNYAESTITFEIVSAPPLPSREGALTSPPRFLGSHREAPLPPSPSMLLTRP